MPIRPDTLVLHREGLLNPVQVGPLQPKEIYLAHACGKRQSICSSAQTPEYNNLSLKSALQALPAI